MYKYTDKIIGKMLASCKIDGKKFVITHMGKGTMIREGSKERVNGIFYIDGAYVYFKSNSKFFDGNGEKIAPYKYSWFVFSPFNHEGYSSIVDIKNFNVEQLV